MNTPERIKLFFAPMRNPKVSGTILIVSIIISMLLAYFG